MEYDAIHYQKGKEEKCVEDKLDYETFTLE